MNHREWRFPHQPTMGQGRFSRETGPAANGPSFASSFRPWCGRGTVPSGQPRSGARRTARFWFRFDGTLALWSPPSPWIHTNRVAGRDCDHCDSDRPVAPRCPTGPRGGPPNAVQKQSQADRDGAAQLRLDVRSHAAQHGDQPGHYDQLVVVGSRSAVPVSRPGEHLQQDRSAAVLVEQRKRARRLRISGPRICLPVRREKRSGANGLRGHAV